MRFDSIQIFRALAANAVVLSHLLGIEGKYGKGYVLLPDWIGPAGPAGVHFFFVISGCVMVFSSRGVAWQDFILSRITRIYPIYWFYTSIVLAAIWLVPDRISAEFHYPGSLLRSYLLWPDSTSPLLTVGWSLVFEMYFYIMWTVILAFSLPIRPALAAWAVVTGLLGFLTVPQSPVLAIICSPLTLEFIIGAVVGLIVFGGQHALRWPALFAGSFGLIFGYLKYLQAPPNDTSLVTVVSLGIPFALLLYAGVSFERTEQAFPSKSKWLVLLGDASYSTYLSHIFVLSVMGRLFSLPPLSGWGAECAFVLSCVVAANLTGVLSYRLLERSALKASRLLLPAMTRKPAVSS